MSRISLLQDRLAILKQLLGLPVVDARRGHQANAAVMVFVIVPRKEDPGPGVRIRLTAEALRVVRAILQGLELRFRERVIAREMGPRRIKGVLWSDLCFFSRCPSDHRGHGGRGRQGSLAVYGEHDPQRLISGAAANREVVHVDRDGDHPDARGTDGGKLE